MPPRMLCKSLLFCVTWALTLGATTEALAQSQDAVVPEEDFYVSGNIFGYFESAESGLSGSSLGGGATFGYYMRPTWTFGGEVAIPAYFTDDDDADDLVVQQHRHVELSALFGWHPARGTMKDISLLVGIAFLQVQVRAEETGEFSQSRGALVVGFDWRIPVAGSLAVVPQARAHVTTGHFVFRAGVGLQVDF